MKFTLKWQMISNQHAYWQRGKIRYMIKKAKDLKQSYIDQIKLESKKINIEEQVFLCFDCIEMSIKYYHWDKRKRDIDNYDKILIDSMQWIIFDDDVQIKKLTLEKFYDKENPRAEVEIQLY